MRIFISDTFKKKYKKVVQDNFSLQFFVNRLIDSNQVGEIFLKRPYGK